MLALMEATSVTGPAKNLIEFANRAARPDSELARVEMVIGAFQRGLIGAPNRFVNAVREAGIAVSIITERFAYDPSVLSQLRNLVATLGPDIIQSHNFKSHFLVRMIGAHRRCRWVAFHHGYTQTNLRNLAYNQMDRWSLPAAHQVVTVCRAFASELVRIGVQPQRIAVQHNSVKPFHPVPQNQGNALREALAIPAHSLVVLCVGRLSREKGHIDLIRAIARLRELGRNRDFLVVMPGEGPERDRLQEAARELGVYDWLIMPGHQEDLGPYYTVADVTVVPSHSEGSPNVLLESMAAGLPIVATSVGGVPDIVVDGNTALLVPRSNPGAMAKALARLLDDENLRTNLGANARRAALDYDPQKSCDFIRQLYDQVLLGYQ